MRTWQDMIKRNYKEYYEENKDYYLDPKDLSKEKFIPENEFFHPERLK